MAKSTMQKWQRDHFVSELNRNYDPLISAAELKLKSIEAEAIEIAEKNVNELEPKARDSKEKLAVLNNVMDAMQNRIKDFEKVMEDLEIAELTKEELDLLTLEYEKRLELHQANLEKDGKRIFER